MMVSCTLEAEEELHIHVLVNQKSRLIELPKSSSLSHVRQGCDHHVSSHHNFLTTVSTRIHLMLDLWKRDFKSLSGPLKFKCSEAVHPEAQTTVYIFPPILINHVV